MKNKIHFLRTLGIYGIYKYVPVHYSVQVDELGIPQSVFQNAMNLIPVNVVDQWYASLEEATQDPDVMLKLAPLVDIEKIGPISHWFFSGHDLALTIRRVNMGLHCLQSGAYLTGAQVGPLIKWSYDNPSYSEKGRVHDSIRVAIFMVKVLRRYLGDNFSPTRVLIAGSRENHKLYTDYFGCSVEWGQERTEIWLKTDLRLSTNQSPNPSKSNLAMSFSDLDDYLNMPDPDDEYKVIYEVINYSRHFGLPTLTAVSNLLNLSEQQFQRRLHKLGVNFSTVMGYVLSNVAVELLRHSIPLDEVSARLGYTNTASFNRMFKKHRGLTPKQYIERFRLND
ncbi:AraC family transcriptional regulator [Vibrio sp. 99-70-13A1]|uniref:AraC family transcriptional regulator n=1 Tax=Vibrio sp. 99-70-13A1 TaxID=2607601 RepID=UPI001C1030C4|nr:AraC family transcriptional regulator [Vibrio sp. 99-70-13A1]